jgi:hypothetical protein
LSFCSFWALELCRLLDEREVFGCDFIVVFLKVFEGLLVVVDEFVDVEVLPLFKFVELHLEFEFEFFLEFDELVLVLLDELVYLAFELLLGVLVELVELLVLLDDLFRKGVPCPGSPFRSPRCSSSSRSWC